MKEKSKRRPHRPFFGLFILLLILIGGYFSLPYAQTAFTNWWADDPLTPICDVPHLELVYTFNENDTQTERLYYWHQGIEPERFGDFYGEFSSLRWSPDFETLYISSRSVGQDYQLLLHANNDLEILPTEFQAWFWSPDGVYAAAISQTGDSYQLRMFDEQAGEAHSMISDNIIAEGRGILHIVWSPNSQRIAFYMNEEVHIMENQNGDWQEIFVYPRISFPLWSPDSELIAFSSSLLKVFNVETGELYWETWGLDRAEVWGERGIIAGYEDIVIADVETQTVQWLADRGHATVIGWSQSNDALLYSPDIVSSSVLDFIEDNEQYTFENGILPQFTPDDRYVNYQGRNNWLYLFDMESRKSCRLFEQELSGFYHNTFAWRIIPQS
jgi:Tol biopolymer transport system component